MVSQEDDVCELRPGSTPDSRDGSYSRNLAICAFADAKTCQLVELGKVLHFAVIDNESAWLC